MTCDERRHPWLPRGTEEWFISCHWPHSRCTGFTLNCCCVSADAVLTLRTVNCYSPRAARLLPSSQVHEFLLVFVFSWIERLWKANIKYWYKHEPELACVISIIEATFECKFTNKEPINTGCGLTSRRPGWRVWPGWPAPTEHVSLNTLSCPTVLVVYLIALSYSNAFFRSTESHQKVYSKISKLKSAFLE